MRKLLLTLTLLVIVLMARSVTATIYVKAEVAPYLYSWYNANNQVFQPLGLWPGTLMTETEVVKGESFWKMSIATSEDVTSFNIIFNNGSGGQTADIVGLSSNRYYTYDGYRSYTDISEEYGTVPNAEISQVEIRGDFNNILEESTTSLMTEGEDHVYTLTLDLSNTRTDQQFKLVVNGSIYGDINSKLMIDAPTGWVEVQGDYCVLHHSVTDYKTYTITATWEENVDAFDGWTLKVEGKDYLYELVDIQEWQMLAAYYQSVNQGSGWVNKWDFTPTIPSVKTLPGVTASDGHVIGIDLSNNGVTGTFPIALLALSNLETLNLSNNQLTGDIGVTMAAYVKMNPSVQIALKQVNISNNQFTGNIGIFAACLLSLQSLDASSNCIEDVYPMISTNVTSLNISKQTISRVVELNLANLTVEDMAGKIPSVLIYNHQQQTFIPEINMLCTTGELADYFNNWSIIISYKNGKATVPYASAANVYYGQSGDVLNVGVVNDNGSLEGSTFRIKLNFDNGDVNFDGLVNVLDVQTDVMFILDNYKTRPFNFTAANLWSDDVINVQDIVPLVNLLFDSEPSITQAPRRAPTTADADAVVSNNGGVLTINTTRPVAAFDITLSGCHDINVNALIQKGFMCEYRQTSNGLRVIGYSLSGNSLPIGETAIGQMSTPDANIIYSQLADTDALEIPSAIGDSTTSISNHHVNLQNSNEIYRLSLGYGHAISIDAHGRKSFVNNTKTMK